jgi:hypothetical protein
MTFQVTLPCVSITPLRRLRATEVFLSVVDFRTDDVTIAIASFFRTGGTGVNVLPVRFTGGTVIIPRCLTRRRPCG